MMHKSTVVIRQFETGYALGVHVLTQDGQPVFIAMVTVDNISQLHDIVPGFIDDINDVVKLTCGETTVPDIYKKAFGE